MNFSNQFIFTCLTNRRHFYFILFFLPKLQHISAQCLFNLIRNKVPFGKVFLLFLFLNIVKWRWKHICAVCCWKEKQNKHDKAEQMWVLIWNLLVAHRQNSSSQEVTASDEPISSPHCPEITGQADRLQWHQDIKRSISLKHHSSEWLGAHTPPKTYGVTYTTHLNTHAHHQIRLTASARQACVDRSLDEAAVARCAPWTWKETEDFLL